MDWNKTQLLPTDTGDGPRYFRRRRVTYWFKDGVPVRRVDDADERSVMLHAGHRTLTIWELQEAKPPIPRKTKRDPIMRAIDLG